MSMGKEDRCYYCRSGSSFIKMEHYMIADRFRRRSYPNLKFVCRIEGRELRGSQFGISIVVGIHNFGAGIALYPALRINGGGRFRPADYGLDGNGHDGLPRRPLPPGSHDFLYASGLDHVIYPQTSIDVTKLVVWIPRDANSCEDFELRYEIYSDEFSDSGIEVIQGKDIL